MAAQHLGLHGKDPYSDSIALEAPANSTLAEPTLACAGLSGWTITPITEYVKDIERAIRFMSYLISEEGQRDMYLGPKGVTYDTIDGKDQFKPEVLELLNSDRTAFDQKYGASHTFWMLMDTDMQLQWQPPTSEPFKQLEDWTKGKTQSFAVYDDTNP